jgi:hypothetical protein
MSTSNRPVTAREYKLMLNVDRFADRAHGSEAFYHLLEFLIKKDGEATVQAESEEKRRLTSYWDTPELALRHEGYALRLRQKKKGFEINLKYRSPDRYLSAARDLASSQNGETKFEEDILPPFVSKFALSTEVDVADAPDLGTVQKVIALFPGLAALNLDADDPVRRINGFEAVEVARDLCTFRFGDATEVDANLSFWYLPENENAWPMVAEFSFDFKASSGNGLEEFPSGVVERANRLFTALQNQAGWVNLSQTTKTAFALESL